MEKASNQEGVVPGTMPLLVRCPDFRGLNVCTLIQMGPWTSVLIIKVSLLVRCPDYQDVLISEVS